MVRGGIPAGWGWFAVIGPGQRPGGSVTGAGGGGQRQGVVLVRGGRSVGAGARVGDVGVCIVAGGCTGLWTAYYPTKAEPSLRVALLERRFCGYGASGRNGGCPGGTDRGPTPFGRAGLRGGREAASVGVC
ncbi:FAD-dependent oxidoreductase [Kitasatospora sp. NPDC017646]|uniref:FAD-dependent oxidoreductase n=1 Tax=Kitasatospora sp. NPDC017646 TaxID=3364024 RepID=UPI00379E06B0